jgi:Alpha/beta hydrolase of unknown function (DUF900)
MMIMTADGNVAGVPILFAGPSEAKLTGYVVDNDAVAASRDQLAEVLTHWQVALSAAGDARTRQADAAMRKARRTAEQIALAQNATRAHCCFRRFAVPT